MFGPHHIVVTRKPKGWRKRFRRRGLERVMSIVLVLAAFAVVAANLHVFPD